MDVGGRVLTAIRWNTAAKVASQVLNWAITIFVIRLLAPEDYGLMAMTMVFVTLISGLADVGLGAAVVQARTLTGDQLRRVQGAVVLASLLAFAIVQLSASVIAAYFGEPRLLPLIRVVAFDLLIAAPAVLSYAQLLRDLRMRATATVEFTAGLLASSVTLALAWLGYGVWSLVVAALVRSAFATMALLVLAPARPWPEFRFHEIGALVRFGGVSTVNQLLHRFGAQIDTIIAGRLLDPAQLGAYSVSMHLASLPAAKIGSVISDVVFAAVSRLQHDPGAVRENLLRALGILALVTFPVFVGLACVAPEAVAVLLGERWSSAVFPLMVLPLVLPLRMMNGILVTAASSMGRPTTSTWYHVTFIMVLTVALAIGASWGVEGLSIAWVIALPLIIGLSLGRALAVLSLRWVDLARCLRAPAAATAVMALGEIGARFFMAGRVQVGPLRLALLIGVGVATYAAASVILNPHGVREAARFARRLIRGEGSARS